MAGCGALSVAGYVADYRFEKLGNAALVDVGGGQGSLSFPILDRYPSLKLVVRFSSTSSLPKIASTPFRRSNSPLLWLQIQDLSPVLPAAEINLATNWPSIDPSRVSYLAHDFFDPNPTTGDDVVYMARWILHDWPDKDCVRVSSSLWCRGEGELMRSARKILKALRVGMSSKNKILIFGSSLPFPPPPELTSSAKDIVITPGVPSTTSIPSYLSSLS